jgi:2-polyprenyl-3-methyl-5-hydroxy-6-metoxy-1,4-benzoquinol methylase
VCDLDHGVHAHDEPLLLEDRHAHESAIYDAMAHTMLAEMSDHEFAVRADRIPFHNREQVDCVSFAIEQLGPLSGQRVLEVGVGGGMLAVWMALQGAEVTGIDVSAGILEVAERRSAVSGVAKSTQYIHCSIEELELPDSHFDLIFGNNVVHHFERDIAMSNLARMLRPEGRAVFCEPVLFLPEACRRLRYSSVVTRRFPPHTHTPDERSLNAGDIHIAECHFGSVEWRPFQLLCRLQNFVELSDAAWNRLESIDKTMLRRVQAARWLARLIVLTLDKPKRNPRGRKTSRQFEEDITP